MIYIETGRNIDWIEIFLRDKHKTDLNQYLTKYFEIPEIYCSKEGKVYCDICGQYFGWLQNHLKKKHDETLDNYLSKFSLKSEYQTQMENKLESNVKKDRELTKLKEKQAANFQLGKEEKLVLEYQKDKKSKTFQYLLKEWSHKIQSHAYRYSSVIQSMSPQEAQQDLYQELVEAFLVATNSYDVTKKIKFNTYAWRCLRNRTQIISNFNQTIKRKVSEQSMSSMRFSDSEADSDDISARFCAQNGQAESGYTSDRSEYIEMLDEINSLDLSDMQRKVIREFLSDKTQDEIARALNITKEDCVWYINDIRRKYEYNKTIADLFFTLREVNSCGIR